MTIITIILGVIVILWALEDIKNIFKH
jgi:hypothetical protein